MKSLKEAPPTTYRKIKALSLYTVCIKRESACRTLAVFQITHKNLSKFSNNAAWNTSVSAVKIHADEVLLGRIISPKRVKDTTVGKKRGLEQSTAAFQAILAILSKSCGKQVRLAAGKWVIKSEMNSVVRLLRAGQRSCTWCLKQHSEGFFIYFFTLWHFPHIP